MGTAAFQSGRDFKDLATGFDLGPPQPASPPRCAVYSLESLIFPGHFMRHRASELWADQKAKEDAELYAFDASFVLVPGLLGYGYSLRCANFPLEYVRRQDAWLSIAEYDGSAQLRADATFELRRADDGHGQPAYNPSGGQKVVQDMEVCLMLASAVGRYVCVAKNNRLGVERYHHPNASAYRFRLTPGLALAWAENIGEPLVSTVVEELGCLIRFAALPKDVHSGQALPGGAVGAQIRPPNGEPAAASPSVARDVAAEVDSEGRSPGALSASLLLPCLALPKPGDRTIEDAVNAVLSRAAATSTLASKVADGVPQPLLQDGTDGAGIPGSVSPLATPLAPVRLPVEFEAVD